MKKITNPPLTNKGRERILEAIRLLLWWGIYIFAIWKAGLWNGIIIGALTMVYGLLSYFMGGEYVESLYKKYGDI